MSINKPISCHLSFVLLTLYPLSHSTTFFCLIPVSTTKLNPLMLVGAIIAWIVVWQDCQSFPTCTLHQEIHSPSRGQEETMTHYPFFLHTKNGEGATLPSRIGCVGSHLHDFGSGTFSSLPDVHVGFSPKRMEVSCA